MPEETDWMSMDWIIKDNLHKDHFTG
jgi:hypothetical protein